MATTKALTTEQTEALAALRELFPVGSTATTLIRHVAASGMSRTISLLANGERGPDDVSYLLVRAGLAKADRNRGGVTIRGGGMDMAFALVYGMSQTLHGDGYAISKRTI